MHRWHEKKLPQLPDAFVLVKRLPVTTLMCGFCTLEVVTTLKIYAANTIDLSRTFNSFAAGVRDSEQRRITFVR